MGLSTARPVGPAVFPLSWLLPAGVGYNVESLQLLITIVIAGIDLWVIYRVLWKQLIGPVAPEDRPYIGYELRDHAKAAHEGADSDRRLARQEAERRAREAERAGR